MKKTILNIGIAAWISMQTISMNAQTYSCNTATTANWQSLGPTTVPTGGGGVGLALTMACHPTDANILYSSGIGGGMWKTVNKGTSWTKLESNQGYFDQSHIGQIAISKSFPNTMYASTGNAAGFSGGGFGMNNLSTGVYKSTNGGTTWTPTGLTGVSTGTNKTWNFGLNNTNYSHVAKLVVHPTNPNIVFAAVITRASWNDVLDTKQGALYKTSDGGITWVQVIGLTNAPSPSVAGIISTYMVDVEFHPTNADIVYASGHRLFKSIDGGTAWTDISNTLPGLQPPMHHVSTLEIAVSPAAPNLLRIAQNTPVNNSRKFLLWSYSHSTHTATKTTEFAGSRYNLVVDPVNASKIYTGTIEYGKPVYRSLDAGLTWALMCTTCTNDPSIHTDIRDIAINPLDGYIYICTDGGISSSPNNEEPAINSWSFKGNGMAITNAGGFDVAQTDGRILLATDHNRLMVYEPSTNTWRANNNTGDGNGAIIDAANSNIMYASDGFNQIILKSTDAFAQDQNSINFAGANNEYGIGSIAAHPNNSNTIYIGKADLWKSTNFGDAPRIKLSNFGNAGLISMIAISPANDNIMYVFDGWNLKRTQDGGLTWSITGKNIFPAYQSFPVQTYEGGVTGGTIITENIAYTDITSITAHPTDPNVVWVTWKAYGNGSQSTSLYKSNDKGATWTNDALGLPRMPAHHLIVDRQSAIGAMYVSTQTGLYYRDHTLSQWQCFNDNLAYGEIRKMAMRYPTREIYASIYGRGIWKSKTACPNIPSDLYVSNSNTPNLNITKWAHNSINAGKSDAATFAPLVIGASNKMTLAAGRSLTIHPGFNSHSGAVFVAYTSQDLNCDHTNVNARTEDLQTLIAPSVISPEPELLAPPTYGLEIFPNPNLGQFKVVPHLKNAEAIQNILIRDASGKLLKSYTGMPFEGSFDIQELENWNFVIMEIVTNQGKYTEKIMRDYRLGDERNRSIKK